MKKLIITSVSILLFAFKQDSGSTDQSKVNTQNGMKVFIMSEPTQPYTIIRTVKTKYMTEFGVGPVGLTKGIDAPVNDLVEKALKKSSAKKRIDAIITSDCETATCIQFEKLGAGTETGKVNTIKGVKVFVRCEPGRPYTKGFEVKLNSKLDLAGLKYSGFGDMINELVDNALVQDKNTEGLITNDGVSAITIKFK